MKTVHSLYNGDVEISFDSEARGNRYIVSDKVARVDKQPVPGTTSILDLALAKKGLMTFPLNAALSHLGATFSEEQGKWVLKQEVRLTSDLVSSAAKAWTVRRDSGADAGTDFHAWVEDYLRDKVAVPPSLLDENRMEMKFHDWYQSLPNVKVLAVEKIVYSRQHQFCGTTDAILEIDGETILCDWKTTNPSRYGIPVNGKWTGIYAEAFLQAGAYCQAYGEEYAQDKGGEWNLNRGKTTSWKIDDIMIVNVTKTGDLHTLRASELGLSVEECESQFLHAKELVNFLSRIKKGQK